MNPFNTSTSGLTVLDREIQSILRWYLWNFYRCFLEIIMLKENARKIRVNLHLQFTFYKFH